MPKSQKNSVNEKQYSRLFKAFGDRSRLKILLLLSSKEMTVNDIARKIGLAQPTVSRHLAVLRDAGAVENRRDGQNVIYSLSKSTIVGCCCGFCDCLDIEVVPAKQKKKC